MNVEASRRSRVGRWIRRTSTTAQINGV